jgi:putative phosphoesterase
MKICIFSDIHGNGSAFLSAYHKILSENADVNIFLGDLCGYYYDQIEIFRVIMKTPNLICIRGNHDQVFIRIASGDDNLRKRYLKQYGHSMENLLKKENSQLLSWLASLPCSYSSSDKKFSCFHGSPDNFLEGYVYPDHALDCYNDMQERFVFLGHTHYKMHRTCCGVHFINPGSLGQPRGGGWPTYAMVDSDTFEVFFREVIYAKNALKSKISEMGDDNMYLNKVLCRQ